MKPIYIVNGHQAGGTSMMMRIMMFGGIEGVYREEQKVRSWLNNPYGVFEGWYRQNTDELEGKVIKAMSVGFSALPEKHKLKIIRIERPSDVSAKSQVKRLQRRVDMGLFKKSENEAKVRDRLKDKDELLEKKIKQINRFKEKTEKALAERKNAEILRLKFDDVLENPERECKKIAEFLKPRDFDWKKASTAVDKTLIHDRESL